MVETQVAAKIDEVVMHRMMACRRFLWRHQATDQSFVNDVYVVALCTAGVVLAVLAWM